MKTSHKGFVGILLLVVIALLFVGGGAYVYTQKSQTDQSATENPTTQATSTTQTSNSQTADWKTYTNNTYNISFQYPSSWYIWPKTQNGPAYVDQSVGFSKSDTEPYPDFLIFYSSELIGKNGAKISPQQYFSTYYAGKEGGEWKYINGIPVFYWNEIGSDARYVIYTSKAEYDFILYEQSPPPYHLASQSQPITQEDLKTVEKIISTLHLTNPPDKFIDLSQLQRSPDLRP